MPFTLNISPLLDVGGFYSAGFPPLTGSIFSPPPPSGSSATPLATATSAGLSLVFSSAAVPPAGSSAVLVTDGGTGGDFLRSGAVGALPASPAAATAITVPTVSIPAATITARAAGIFVPATAVPTGIRILSGVLTGGTFIPLVVALGPATATLAPGSITVALTGVLTARVFFFSVSAIAITATTTVTLAPSADATNPARILRVTLSPITFSGIGAAVGLVLGPFLASLLSGVLESMLNGLILSTASSAVSGTGLMMTPTAVISARRVTITASGVALQLVLADLFGPALVAPPKTLSVSISPPPVANTVHTYTVTVLDSVSSLPVVGANVTLQSIAGGTPTSHLTDAAGKAVFPNVTLKIKRVVVIDTEDGKPRREVDLIPPTLTVTAAGYNSVALDLL
jgi:hypothetical protein